MFFYREESSPSFSPAPSIYWKCDQVISGQSPDYFNNYPLTATNITVGATAKIDSSLQLINSNNYVLEASAASILKANPNTISVWFYFTQLNSSYPTVFSKDGSSFDYTAIIVPSNSSVGNLRFYRSPSGGPADLGTVYSNTWYNLVVTWDGSSRSTIYLNGNIIMRGEDTWWTTNGTDDSQPFRLGNGYPDYGNRRWDGFIDEVAVWNSVLDSTKIAEIYSFGNAGNKLI